MKYYLLPLLATTLFFTGCASIVSKSQYPVAIRSNPSGATFVIKKANGELISSGTTPKTVVLKASAGYFRPANYTVQFTYNGITQSVPITASLDGWYIGNVGFGGFGLLGWLVIDPATGAMWRLNDSVTATFNRTAQNERELRVSSIDDIPASWKTSLVALN